MPSFIENLTSGERSNAPRSKSNAVEVGLQNPVQQFQAPAAVPLVQKKDEEELTQTKSAIQKVSAEEELQKKADPAQLMGEEEEAVQGKFAAQLVKDEELPKQMKAFQLKSDGGLPADLRSGVESLSGLDMSDVKVNYNSPKPAQLHALAYAQGSEIHIGPGQEQHLPHEAWHVAQQKQGRVQPTMQMKEGVPVNDDKALEQEADVMGAKALQQGSAR